MLISCAFRFLLFALLRHFVPRNDNFLYSDVE
jgi:hypothetical protein